MANINRTILLNILFCFTLLLFSFPAQAQQPLFLESELFVSPQRNQIIQAELDTWDNLLSNQQNTLTPDFSPAIGNIDAESSSFIPEEETFFTPADEQKIAETDKTPVLRNEIIEITMEYLFAIQGEQTFEVVVDGARISRLHYPHRGGMWFAGMEAHLGDKLSFGGRYGNSSFETSTVTDSDWWPPIENVWWESNSQSKPKTEAFDVNAYLRLVDTEWNKDQQYRLLADTIDLCALKNINARWTFDIFAGYQYQKNSYRMTDLVDTVEWWTPVNNPIDGLDSTYRVTYQGPRLGFRTQISNNKYSGRLSFAYAWLSTDADGWWNLREYSFHQEGKNGYGLDFNAEALYKFTPHISGGIGFNYVACKQRKMKESGSQPGFSYTDEDIIRNVDSSIYAPYTVVKLIW